MQINLVWRNYTNLEEELDEVVIKVSVFYYLKKIYQKIVYKELKYLKNLMMVSL